MAIRYIDEARKPRIRYLDEEPPFIADRAARAALVRPSSEWDRIARDASRPAEDRRRARDEEEFQAVQGMVLRGAQVNPDLVAKWQHRLQLPQGSTAKAASPTPLPTPAQPAPEPLPVYQQPAAAPTPEPAPEPGRVLAQLQSDIDNDIPVDPALLAQYRGQVRLPPGGQVRVVTDPAVAERVAARQAAPEEPLPTGTLAPANIATGFREGYRDLLGYAPEQALALSAQALDFFPGIWRGAKEAARSVWVAAIGEDNTRKLEELSYKIPMLGPILKASDAVMEASGRLRRETRDLLMQEAMEQGGMASAAAATLVDSVEQTLMNLKAFKALGLGYGMQAGVKSTLQMAAARSAIMAATQEGLTPKDRLFSALLGFAYQSTPALSSTIGKWAQSDWIAKLADVSANFGITATQLPRMLRESAERAEAEGKPDMGGFYFLMDAVKSLGSDVVFGMMTQAFRGQPGAQAAFKRIHQQVTNARMDERAPEPVSPVRIDLPAKPEEPVALAGARADDVVARAEAERAAEPPAEPVTGRLVPLEPPVEPPARPAAAVQEPAAPQPAPRETQPAYPLVTAPAGSPHPFVDSQGRYVDAAHKLVQEPISTPPPAPTKPEQAPAVKAGEGAAAPLDETGVRAGVEAARKPPELMTPEESGWTPEIPGWTARVNSYLAGDRQISDVLDMAKTNPANAVWHLRNTARVKRIEGTPGFDTKTADRLEKLADRVETKLMNVGPSTAAGSRTPSADEPPPPPAAAPASTPPPAPTKQTETPVGEGAQAPNKLTEARAGAEAAKVDEPVVAPPPKPVEQLKQKMKGKKAGVKVVVEQDGDKTISVPSKDNEGLPPKEQKKYLLAEIDKAIADAPDDAAAIKETPEQLRASKAQAERVDIESKLESKWSAIKPQDPGYAATKEEKAAFYAERDRLLRGDPLASDMEKLMREFNVPDTKAEEPGYMTMAGNRAGYVAARPYTFDERVEILRWKMASAAQTKFQTVTIEVPGDGKFEVQNSKRALDVFRKKAATEFPATTPKTSQRKGPSIAQPKIAAVGKRPAFLDKPSWQRLLQPFASNDETHPNLSAPSYDAGAKAMVSTDGRRLAVALGSRGEVTKNFPNWKQVVPGWRDGKLPDTADRINVTVNDTEKLTRQLRQASQVMDKGINRNVDLFISRDGELIVAASNTDVGEYRGGELSGARYVATMNADHMLETLAFMRGTGNQSAIYSFDKNPDIPTMLTLGSKEFVVQAPMKTEQDTGNKYGVELAGVTAEPPGPGLRGGPGAAAAEGEGEFAPRGEVQGREPEGGITSIRNRQTDMEREQLGLPKAEPIIRRAFPQVHDQVVRELDGDPTVGKRLIEDLRRNPRALTDREDCILLHEQVQAQAEYNRAAQATNKAAASGDKKAQAEAEARMGVALDTLFDVYQVGRKAGTESARGLNARKMFADENFDLVSLQLQKRASTGGDPLTRDQTAEVERIKAEYDKTKKALDELQSLYDEAKKANKPTITTEKKLRDAQKKHAGVVKKWQDGLRRSRQDPKRWADAIDEYLTERKTTVPADELNRIKGELRDASKLGDEQARDAAIARAINRFVSFVPLKTGDWFDAYIYTNMLSNPMSHARNTIGNLTNMMALRPLGLLVRGDVRGAKTYIKKAVGAVLDGSAWRKAMTSFGAGEPAKMVEVMADLPKSGSAIARLKRQMAIAKRGKGPENVLGRAAWKSLNWVGDFMQAQDQFVRQMIERGETARLVQRGETADYAEQRAKEIASQYLYHDKMGEPDKSLDQVTRTMEHIGLAIDHLRRIPGVPGRVFKMAAPFLKTPVKIAQFNAQTSFLGFIGANRNRIAKTRYGAKSFADIEARLQAERSKSKPDLELTGKLEEQIDDINQTSGERYGKAMVGTALTMLGSIWAANSNTAWEAPKDKKARQLSYDSGRRPYSFRVGNKWIPMMYLGPGMISFAIPAAIRHIAVDDPDSVDDSIVENAVKLMLAVPSMLIDQLPLEGVASLMNMVRGKDEYTWKRFVGRLGTQVVPVSGMMSFIKNMIDPTYRKVVTIEDTIKAGIPGLSEHVEAIKDSEGMDAKASVWDALWPYKIGKRDLAKEEALQDRLESMRERKRAKKLPASAPVALPPFTGVKFLTDDNTGSKRAP